MLQSVFLLIGVIVQLSEGVLVELAGRCGTFESHSTYGSGSYGPNINNEWIIRSDQPIELTFTQFDIFARNRCKFCRCDYVEVRDGDSSSAPLIGGLLCGRSLRDVISSGNSIYVKFFSNGPNRRRSGSGFSADYKSGNCDGTDPVEPTDPLPPPPPPPTPSSCGVPSITPRQTRRRSSANTRIIGGTDAVPHSWPWMCYIGESSTGGSPYCGCSLIDATWVITAAHCVDGEAAGGVYISFGAHDLRQYTQEGVQTIQAGAIYTHSGYRNLNYDYALVKLSSAVTLSDKVKPVCLPATGFSPVDNQNVMTTGWGTTSTVGQVTPDILQQVELQFKSDQTCRRGLRRFAYVDDTMMCADSNLQGQDACYGDSGGPLVVLEPSTGAYTLIGLTSWGDGCAARRSAGVWAEVSHVRSWIDQTMSQN